jgi:hypothetical protein
MNVNRRDFVALSAATATAGTAGCVQLEGFDGGILRILIVDTIPPGVQAVDRSNSAVSSSDLLRRGLNEVPEKNYYQTQLTRAEYQDLKETFSGFQYYDRIEDQGSTQPSGYYVSLDGEYAVVKLRPYCSDIPGVSMEEERGDCTTAK